MDAEKLPTILIADDHQLLNDALASLLSASDVPYQPVGQVYNGDDVLPAVDRLRPDIVLLDINMPGLNGLDVAKRVLAGYPTTRVVMLTMYGETKFVEAARRLGVAGYMLKNIRKDNLLGGLDIVLTGKTYYDPNLRNSDANQHQEDDFLKQFNLTKREGEIIPLLCQGLTNAQTGNKLFLGELTIKTYRKNIYQKLGVSHLADLIKFARTHNLWQD